MTEESEELVSPGEKIGTSEEWMSGEGTYEEHGNIYSSVFGRVAFDEDNLEATVEPLNPISELNVGDIIYGTVNDRRGSMVTVDVEIVEGEERGIDRDIEGSLHISKVSDDYVEELKDAYLKQDIIRAEVTQVEPSVQLTTAKKALGVVRGLCSRCRRTMELEGSRLYCPSCDRTEDRKLSSAYGKIKIKKRS